jgi:hypothetical protein
LPWSLSCFAMAARHLSAVMNARFRPAIATLQGGDGAFRRSHPGSCQKADHRENPAVLDESIEREKRWFELVDAISLFVKGRRHCGIIERGED